MTKIIYWDSALRTVYSATGASNSTILQNFFVRERLYSQRPYKPRRRSQTDSQQLHEIDNDGDQQQEELMEHYVMGVVDIPESHYSYNIWKPSRL